MGLTTAADIDKYEADVVKRVRAILSESFVTVVLRSSVDASEGESHSGLLFIRTAATAESRERAPIIRS